MDEGKEKAKKVWELLSETTYELDKNRRGYEDIEVLKEWIQNKNIYIIFHSDGWRVFAELAYLRLYRYIKNGYRGDL